MGKYPRGRIRNKKQQQKPQEAGLEAKIRVNLEEPEGIPPTRPTLGPWGCGQGSPRHSPEPLSRCTPPAPRGWSAPGPGIRPSRPHPHTRASATQEPPAGSGGRSGARGGRPSPPARPPVPLLQPGRCPARGGGTHRGSLTPARGSDTRSADTGPAHTKNTQVWGAGAWGARPPICALTSGSQSTGCAPRAPPFRAPPSPTCPQTTEARRELVPALWAGPGLGGCKRTSVGENCRDRTQPDSQAQRPPRRDTQGQHNKYEGPPTSPGGPGGGQAAAAGGEG